MQTPKNSIGNKPLTIWAQLDAWAVRFKPWQKFILATAVRQGRLSNAQVDVAFEIFLRDFGLSDRTEKVAEIPSAITGRPQTNAPTQAKIVRIGSLSAVNALPSTAELTFSPGLTVIYGGNGVGKSSFTRVLSNTCFSRTQHKILPNVFDDKAERNISATIQIDMGGDQIVDFIFDGSNENRELKSISIFDTAVAKNHLVEASPLGFKPAGFDIFPEMARVYGLLSDRLTAEIDARNKENIFGKSFVGPDSKIARAVKALSADNDLAELKAWALFGEVETARLEEVMRQIQAISAKSVAETVRQLEAARADLLKLLGSLEFSAALLADEMRAEIRRLLKDLHDKMARAAAQGAESFHHDSLKGVGSPEWEGFLTSAQKLAVIEGEHYPHGDEPCLLCQRPLDPESMSLIQRYWVFLNSAARTEVEGANKAIDVQLRKLKAHRLSFFEASSTVYAHVTRLAPQLVPVVTTAIEQMERERTELVAILTAGAGIVGVTAVPNVCPEVQAVVDQVSSDIERLKLMDEAGALALLEAERVELRHRQVLNQLIKEIELYVNGLLWVRKASGDPKRGLSPRPLTDKESELFDSVIARGYREKLADECKFFGCELPIELRTQGQRGQTVRSLSLKGGHSPDKVLSEGEQRAVSLADFLTEVGLNPASAGIILDDPVTSQDHERKQMIAHRIVLEAKARQVIVFTHDLVFLDMISGRAMEESVEILTHWIERDGHGKPGQVALDDSPATTPQYRDTRKAKKTLEEAKSASGSARVKLIQRGMGELRRTVEEIIPHHVLKQVVTRWSDRVIVTALKKINWDTALIDDIVKEFEFCSGYMEGHSHTEERSGGLPEPALLEAAIGRVDLLIRRSKPDKPK